MKRSFYLFFVCLIAILVCSCDANKVEESATPSKTKLYEFTPVSCVDSATGISTIGLTISADAGNVYKKITVSVKNNDNSVLYLNTVNYTGTITLSNGHTYYLMNPYTDIMPGQTASVDFYVETLSTEKVTDATCEIEFLGILDDTIEDTYTFTLTGLDL